MMTILAIYIAGVIVVALLLCAEYKWKEYERGIFIAALFWPFAIIAIVLMFLFIRDDLDHRE